MSEPDAYLPGHGDIRYRVRHVELRLDLKVTTNRLDEVAVIDVVVTQPLRRLKLDLAGLQASKVLLDGRRTKFRHSDHKLVVETGPCAPGDELQLTLHCSGKPRPSRGVHGGAGWEELTDGVMVASQPHGAPSWFPCNDDAADKATYRIQVDVAEGYHVVSNGTLVEQLHLAGRQRFVHEMNHPMSPYLATVQVGRYVVDRRAAPVPLEIVHPAKVAVGAGTSFEHQAAMLEVFSELFGAYPFEQYRAVVVDDDLEIPLEAQGLSSFGRNLVPPVWDNERLVAHELAHQWFGNAVTAAQLSDIWLHEGFACYAEWLWSDRCSRDRGTDTVQQLATEHHAVLAGLPQDLVLRDPGMKNMFDDRVYKRGALCLHAVRATVGDELFFELLRSWVVEHSGGSVTTDEFVTHVLSRVGDGQRASLAELMDSWLAAPALPSLPVLG